MKKQADIVSSILKDVADKVAPGVTTRELDSYAEELVKKAGATPYNKGYKPEWAKSPYPATLVTNVNSTIAHGIPDDYKLQEGDIINLDLGIRVDKLCGDCAITVPVGKIENKNQRLLLYAKRALYAGIEVIKPGIDVTDIGQAIQTFSWRMGYKVNKYFMGHFIGGEMHEKPVIPHFNDQNEQYRAYFAGRALKVGDVLCLEPMLTWDDELGYPHPNGWARLTRNGKYSAMFEHMVEVTETGYNILTTHFTQDLYEPAKTA